MAADPSHRPLLPLSSSSSPHEPPVPVASSVRLSTQTIWEVRSVLALASVKPREWLLLLCLPASVLAYLYSAYLVVLAPGRVYKTLMTPDWSQFRVEIRLFGIFLLFTTSLRVLRALLRDATANLLRARLGSAVHARYLTSGASTFLTSKYPGIDNVDQRAAADVTSFCESLLTLFAGESAQASGGAIEAGASLAWYSVTVAARAGMGGVLVAYIWSLSAALLSIVAVNAASPPRFLSEVAEADLRYAHMRTRDEAEEIAFSYAHRFERRTLDNALFKAVQARWAVVRANVSLNFVDHGFSYCVTLVMYAAVALAVLAQVPITSARVTFDKLDEGDKAQWIAQTGGVFIQLLFAFTMLVGLGTPISALVAHTQRLHALLLALDDPKIREKEHRFVEIDPKKTNVGTALELRKLQVALPDGRLTPPISLDVALGERILLAGPSGVGKTTVLRSLRGLVDPCEGDFKIPPDTEFVPQRARIPSGCHRLLEIVLYPAFPQGGLTEDANVRAALNAVGWTRGDNINDVADWSAILSPGERQRVIIAGVLVRRPRFCILDEPTSSLDSGAEMRCFAALQEGGIGLLTVAHSEALRALHDSVIHM